MKKQPIVPPSRSAKVLVIPAALCLLLLVAVVWRLPHPAAPPPQVKLPEFNRTNLVRVDGRWCEKGRTNPFTGILLEFYADGKPESRSTVSNGLLNGLSEGWYTNSQLQVREYYLTNYSDGLRTKWYPDGKKQSEATIKLGQMEGVFRRWYENGRVAEDIPMHDGKIEGTGQSYYESGFMKTELTIHDGKMIQVTNWPDGRQPAPAQAAPGS